MKEILNRMRTPDKNMKIENKILNTFLIFLLGIILGIFSKSFLVPNTLKLLELILSSPRQITIFLPNY